MIRVSAARPRRRLSLALAAVTALVVHTAGAPIPRAEVPRPDSAAQGRASRPPDPEGPRVRALVVSGGCCHDYPGQARMLMDAISGIVPVDWMVAIQGGRSTRGHQPVFERDDWAKGYDIVVHNQCFADVTDEQLIRRITGAHRGGPPALVIHCAMHTFRAATVDAWREFLGVTSHRHTRQFAMPVKVVAKDHAVMRGFREDWVTPVDELYVVDKFWPGATALATAVSPEDQREYPLAWVNDYGGTRVFGTTLGHGNATFEDPVFQDLLARGFKWALNRD
jgi:uncharacterized protein